MFTQIKSGANDNLLFGRNRRSNSHSQTLQPHCARLVWYRNELRNINTPSMQLSSPQLLQYRIIVFQTVTDVAIVPYQTGSRVFPDSLHFGVACFEFLKTWQDSADGDFFVVPPGGERQCYIICWKVGGLFIHIKTWGEGTAKRYVQQQNSSSSGYFWPACQYILTASSRSRYISRVGLVLAAILL